MNDVGKCIFCGIVNGERPCSKVCEDEALLAFMDIQPVNEGHILIIPKKHFEFVSAVDEATLGKMAAMAKAIGFALRNASEKCEGINWFLADGEAAGQEITHVHLHVIPRFEGDGFGLRFPAGYKDKPSRQELDQTADRIAQSMRHS